MYLNTKNKKYYKICLYSTSYTSFAYLLKLEAWYLEYVDPTRDGKGEAVTGNGQIGLCGARAEGKPAFRA